MFRYTVTGWRATVSFMVPSSGWPGAGSWLTTVLSGLAESMVSTGVTVIEPGSEPCAFDSGSPTRLGAVVIAGTVVVVGVSVWFTGGSAVAFWVGAGLDCAVRLPEPDSAHPVSTPMATSRAAALSRTRRRRRGLGTAPPTGM